MRVAIPDSEADAKTLRAASNILHDFYGAMKAAGEHMTKLAKDERFRDFANLAGGMTDLLESQALTHMTAIDDAVGEFEDREAAAMERPAAQAHAAE